MSFLSLVQSAVGDPYTWGGVLPSTGFDCSGLVYWAAKRSGIGGVPRTSEEQYAALAPVAAPTTGDLVFFGSGADPASHVGICANDGCTRMINAPHTGATVGYATIPGLGGQWGADVVTGYRTLGPAASPGVTAGGGGSSAGGSGCFLGWKLPGSGLPVVGGALSGCVVSDGEAAGVLGALVIVAGVALALTGLVLAVHGRSVTGPRDAARSAAAIVTAPVRTVRSYREDRKADYVEGQYAEHLASGGSRGLRERQAARRRSERSEHEERHGRDRRPVHTRTTPQPAPAGGYEPF